MFLNIYVEKLLLISKVNDSIKITAITKIHLKFTWDASIIKCLPQLDEDKDTVSLSLLDNLMAWNHIVLHCFTWFSFLSIKTTEFRATKLCLCCSFALIDERNESFFPKHVIKTIIISQTNALHDYCIFSLGKLMKT